MSDERFNANKVSEKQIKNAKLFAIKTCLIIINTLLFSLMWYQCFKHEMWGTAFYKRGDYFLIILYIILYAALTKFYGGLQLKTSSISELVYSQAIAICITNILAYLVILLLIRQPIIILAMLSLTITQGIIALFWSYIANHLTNRICKSARILLLYENADAYRNGKNIIEKLAWRFQLIGEVDMSLADDAGDMQLVDKKIHETNADSVMLCGLTSSQRNDVIKYCVEKDIRAYVRPNIGDFIIGNGQVLQMANLPIVICERASQSLYYQVIKRGADIVISILGLIITSPILLVTAIAIKSYDHGSVLYRQTRLTKDGREFEILKFRSMKQDAEKDGVARLASDNDDRITPVGKIIRKCRIDELPQLWNILKGDLSLVGPRPERPEIAREYAEKMPEFGLRLQVKAGLTGYAQVYGKYNTEPYDKLQMDLMYISKMGAVTDVKIMMATIKILFMPESTEGISEGQTTAMGRETHE